MASTNTTPKVGTPATYRIGSDRYPYIVVAVRRNGRTLVLSPVDVRVTEGRLFGEVLETTEVATLRRDGKYRPKGSKHGLYSLGVFKYERDPHF